MDKFSHFIVTKSLETIEATPKEQKMFYNLCQGKGLTPRRAYTEGYELTKLYMQLIDTNSPAEEVDALAATYRKLYKIITVAELEEYYVQGNSDAMVDNLKVDYTKMIDRLNALSIFYNEEY